MSTWEHKLMNPTAVPPSWNIAAVSQYAQDDQVLLDQVKKKKSSDLQRD